MDAASARRLFDANAATYDGVNSAISLGMVSGWYDWAALQLVTHPGARVLDAFGGSGGVGLRAAAKGALVTLADASPRMLERARTSAGERGLAIRTVVADLESPEPAVAGAPFEAAAVMWGLRYVDDPVATLRGIGTLLEPGGRVVVVEFVMPEGGTLSSVAGFYFMNVLPAVAGTLAGDRSLYEQLVTTTRAMGPPERLLGMVRDGGYEITSTRSMGFGMVQGVVAHRR